MHVFGGFYHLGALSVFIKILIVMSGLFNESLGCWVRTISLKASVFVGAMMLSHSSCSQILEQRGKLLVILLLVFLNKVLIYLIAFCSLSSVKYLCYLEREMLNKKSIKNWIY
jgi:hypothetical protein